MLLINPVSASNIHKLIALAGFSRINYLQGLICYLPAISQLIVKLSRAISSIISYIIALTYPLRLPGFTWVCVK